MTTTANKRTFIRFYGQVDMKIEKSAEAKLEIQGSTSAMHICTSSRKDAQMQIQANTDGEIP